MSESPRCPECGDPLRWTMGDLWVCWSAFNGENFTAKHPRFGRRYWSLAELNKVRSNVVE